MSLALATTQSIAGVAGTGSAITYTLTGDELSGSPVSDAFKVLAQGTLPTVAGTLYTATSVQALVKAILLANVTGSAVNVSLFINGTAAGNQIVSLVIPANGEATWTDGGWQTYDSTGARTTTGSTGPQGVPGATFRGAYNGGTAYVVNDVVSNGGSSWINILASTGNAPPTLPTTSNTWWSALSIKGDQGTTGSQGPAGPVASVTATDATIVMAGTGSAPTVGRGHITGDIDVPANSNAATLATVNSNVGSFGDASHVATFTVNGKGLTTAAGTATITPAAIGAPATTRLINTTAPLTGGGDLSADRTLAISTATPSAAGAMSAAMANTVTNLWLDVTNYGVAPGNSATANTTALNNLVGASGTAPAGATIFFPGGTYQFNGTVTVGKAFTFRGQGENLTGGYSILELVTQTTGFMTLTSGNWYTTFHNLVFVAATTQTSGSMIAVNDNVAVNFIGVAFGALGGQLWNCIDFTGTSAAANTTVVDRCFMGGFKNFGINVSADGASLVVVNTIMAGIWGTSTQCAAACLNVTNAGAVQVDNCDFIGAVNNVLLNATSGKVIASVYMTNTYMDNAFGSCLKITGAGATVRCRFIAVSFTTSNAGTGFSAVEISTSVAAGAQGIDFENCSILNTFGTTGTTNGFLITGAADFTINACRVAGWTNGIQITPFGANGTTQPMIEDNTIGPTGGYGANSVGILLNAGATQYGAIMIQNNMLQGNTTPLTDNSTQTATAQKLLSGNTGMTSGVGVTVGAFAGVTTTVESVVAKLAIPANSLKVGSVFRYSMFLHPAATTITTVRLHIGVNGTTADAALIIMSATAATNAASRYCEGIIAIQAIGAAATFIGGGTETVGAITAAGAAAAATSSFNSAVANFITLTVQNTSSTTTTVYAAVLEAL